MYLIEKYVLWINIITVYITSEISCSSIPNADCGITWYTNYNVIICVNLEIWLKVKKNITHQHFFHNFWSISGKFTDFLKGAKRRAGMVAGFEVWKRELDSTFIIQFIPNSKMIGMNICRIKTPKINILKLTRKCSKYKQNVYDVARS